MVSKVLRHTVAGKVYKSEEDALNKFWEDMGASLHTKRPQEVIVLDQVDFDKMGGWTISYVIDMEDLPKEKEIPAPRPPELEIIPTGKDGPRECFPQNILITGHNPRKHFDQVKLDELKESIRAVGIIEPLVVRPKGSKYELVAGERRLRAARELKLEVVPIVVRELTDEQMLEVMISENLQREDLNPIEEAHHLKRVLEVGKLTQTELGRRLGKSQEWVAHRLRMASMPTDVQEEIIRRRITQSSVIDLAGWQQSEHFDDIWRSVKDELVDGEELPRARVREIIKDVTDPGPSVVPAGSAWEEPEDDPIPDEPCESCIIGAPTPPPKASPLNEALTEALVEVEDEDEEMDGFNPIPEEGEEEPEEPEASVAGRGHIQCLFRDSGWTASGDEVQDVLMMTTHLMDARREMLAQKSHDKAAHQLAKLMLQAPEVKRFLDEHFTREVPK